MIKDLELNKVQNEEGEEGESEEEKDTGLKGKRWLNREEVDYSKQKEAKRSKQNEDEDSEKDFSMKADGLISYNLSLCETIELELQELLQKLR